MENEIQKPDPLATWQGAEPRIFPKPQASLLLKGIIFQLKIKT